VSNLVILFLAITAAACSAESTASSPAEVHVQPPPVELPAGMTRVADISQVWMVNDRFMGKPQIPIAVEGRTYYGCCAMCKDRLGTDPKARTARDPVTGESVDKATAVIVQDKAGKVMYFASERTLSRYRG